MGAFFRGVLLFPLMLSIALLLPAPAFADGGALAIQDCAGIWSDIKKEEKEGRPELAYSMVPSILIKNAVDGPNPYYKDAVDEAKRLSANLAGEHIRAGRWEQAAEVYEAINDFASADKVMREGYSKKKVTAAEALLIMADHVIQYRRIGKANMVFEYTANKDTAKPYVADINAAVAAEMSKEEKLATRKEISPGELLMGPHHLKTGRTLNEPVLSEKVRNAFGEDKTTAQNEKTIKERAEQRGDHFSSNDDPAAIRITADYYRVTPNAGKLKKLRARAEKLGDAAAARNDFISAHAYYEVAEAREKREGVDKRIAAREKEAAKSHNPKKMEEDLKKMRKNDSDKRKFKKEQNDMEKELGF